MLVNALSRNAAGLLLWEGLSERSLDSSEEESQGQDAARRL